MNQPGGDYSFSRPGGAALKAAGLTWVARYLSTDTSKALSSPETTDLFNNGLDVVLVFENQATQALDGQSQGVADANRALSQASALGVPDSVPIYFAVDFDVSAAQLAVVKAYFTGACSVLGVSRVGVYGGYAVVQSIMSAGLASYAWQTVGWSKGKQYPSINIYQTGANIMNGSVDLDTALTTNFGQWSKGDDTMTDQGVINLYLLALHRQPENQATIDGDVGKDFVDVSAGMLTSAEWLTLNDWLLVEYPKLQTQVAQLQQELASSASDNTKQILSDMQAVIDKYNVAASQA